MVRGDLKLPRGFKLLVYFVLLIGCTSLVAKVLQKPRELTDLGDSAVIFTLAAVLLYVFYTYSLAKEAWTPSASFDLKATNDNPYFFFFFLKNHSKFSLNCWCKLNASVYGQSVLVDGFYGGKTSFDLQPFALTNGVLDIRWLLAKVNRKAEDLVKEAKPENAKLQLHLDIEFWYNCIDDKTVIKNPKQPRYFDFKRKQLIGDF